ncbi:hypothetical protein F5Y14DRAFT_451029 [Nemania sp. NC0429]|nr:hypothetical protein F5Y14DRAFT_451029 [Nemania sp. NC0429]
MSNTTPSPWEQQSREKMFPQFANFPAEIRLAVWSHFRLSKTMYHVITEVGIASFPVPQQRPVVQMDQEQHKDVRSLMQVNREARFEVLRGRHLQKLKVQADRIQYCFVNWDLDLFRVECLDFIHDKEFGSQIKNIAFEILGPVNLLTYLVPFGINPLKIKYGLIPPDMKRGERSKMWKSVKRLVLLQCLLILDDDNPEQTWKSFEINHWGLHTINTEIHGYGENDRPVLYNMWADETSHTSFAWYVKRMISDAKRDIMECVAGRNVECQMMIDHQGFELGNVCPPGKSTRQLFIQAVELPLDE